MKMDALVICAAFGEFNSLLYITFANPCRIGIVTVSLHGLNSGIVCALTREGGKSWHAPSCRRTRPLSVPTPHAGVSETVPSKLRSVHIRVAPPEACA